jgi:hypothetical protein
MKFMISGLPKLFMNYKSIRERDTDTLETIEVSIVGDRGIDI